MTMGRAIVTFFLILVAVGVVVGVGTEVYNTGFTQGVLQAEHVPAGQPVPTPGYGYGYGYHGFNFLGLLFPLFFLFLIFGLIRAAFFRGRGWGPGGWGHGYGRGHGWGPGWDRGDGPAGPTAWREERDRRMAELHRRLHDEEAGAKPAAGDPGSSAGPTAG
jgi:hypothetical protein